jgi:hypothetical protein
MENNRHGGKGTWLAVFGLNCAKQGGGKEMIAAIYARKSTEQNGASDEEG